MQMTTGDQSPVIEAKGNVTVNYGFTLEQYEEIQRKLLKEVAGDEQKRKVVEAKLADLEKSYEEAVRRRMAAEEALIQSKGQVPDEQIKQALASLQTGDTQAAEKTLDTIEEQADKNAARAAFHSGQLAKDRLDYAKAMRKYRKAVERDEDNPEYLLAAGNMASVLADYQHAEEWFKHVLDFAITIDDHVHIDNILAGIYQFQGKYDEAELKYNSILSLLGMIETNAKMDGRTVDDDHYKNISTILNNLGWMYSTQGRYVESEDRYLRSMSILQALLRKHEDDPLTDRNKIFNLYIFYSSCCSNLGWLCTEQGRYNEAESLYLYSLEVQEKLLREDDPYIAPLLNNLAWLYYKQGRFKEAEPLYLRSLEMKKKTIGENHHDTASTWHNLALLYIAQGRYDEAEVLVLKDISIREKTLVEDDMNLARGLDSLACIYDKKERYKESEQLYLRSLAIREKVGGENNPYVAEALNNLAVFYDNQGRHQEAEPLHQRAIAIKKKNELLQKTCDELKREAAASRCHS